jgi:hypothetical protein
MTNEGAIMFELAETLNQSLTTNSNHKHSISKLRKSLKYQLLGIDNCYTFGNFAKYI